MRPLPTHRTSTPNLCGACTTTARLTSLRPREARLPTSEDFAPGGLSLRLPLPLPADIAMPALLLAAAACASFVQPLAHRPARGARFTPSLIHATAAADQRAASDGRRATVLDKQRAPQPEGPPQPQTALVLLLCCAIGCVCALDRVLMSIAILPMAEQYDYSDSTKGAIAAGFSLGYCLGLAPTSAAASTGSPKAVLLIGLLVWSIAQTATPAAAALGLPSLLAARAVMGVGEAAAVPSLQAIAARFVPPERRSLFWGCLTASLSCGTIGAYVLSPPLIDQNGWPYVFAAYGISGLLIAAAWGVWGADAPSGAPGEAPRVAASDAGSDATGLSSVPWRRIATSRPVWALAASHMSANFFLYFGLSWLPTYFAYQFGLSTADASSASLYPFAAGAVGSLTAGAACDALVSRLGFSLTNARKLIQSTALGGPAIAMLALALLSAGVNGMQLTRDEAEALFTVAVGCQAASAAGCVTRHSPSTPRVSMHAARC